MAERVVLHVGAMKSGTSYIQAQLFANKDALLQQGVVVPGQHWGNQVTGVLDVLGKLRFGRESVTGDWQRLLDEIDASPGTAVVSMEFLGPVRPAKIADVVDSLQGHRVSVVLTARDLNRSIAAMWQETIQNGRWWTWEEYLAAVEQARPRDDRSDDDISKAGRTFWRQQNTVRMSRAWSRPAGVADYAFITVPAPGAPPELLMERFGQVVGFDPAGLEPGPRANASVGAASAQMLRRVNVRLAKAGLEFPLGANLRKHRLAKNVLSSRASSEPKIGLPVAEWVTAYAEHMVATLQTLDLDLVGDWSDLEPVAVPGVDPGQVSEAEIQAAAAAGLEGLRPFLEPRLDGGWPAGSTERSAVDSLADVMERGIRLDADVA